MHPVVTHTYSPSYKTQFHVFSELPTIIMWLTFGLCVFPVIV